jgi:acyl-CoA dehydrogenase
VTSTCKSIGKTTENSLMDVAHTLATPLGGSDALAHECVGQNFFAVDKSLQDLLPMYMPAELHSHMLPHFERLGELAGGRLDALARTAENHPPVLHPRDRFGRDHEWIEYHPAYHEMERYAFSEFGLQAMTHRAGVLGWNAPVDPIAKYVFQYLFVQAEFGLMCPVSVSDTSAFMLQRYGDEALKAQFLPGMLSQDMSTLLRGTQFMTEKAAGSDVGRIESEAIQQGGEWRVYGEKWFCSHADADVAMMLSRPQGAGSGTGGLGLFLLPRHLENGERNRYRIVRLKDKMGTRSMASGEIRLEGARVYPVGDLSRGLKQMMEQVNLSRLSHGVRAASMMRRCLNEARASAFSRQAFGRHIGELPLAERELTRMTVRTEQALSMVLYTASLMDSAGASCAHGDLLRILTPMVKYGACRDNIEVATAAMEMRGGNGYIEDWVNSRLVRDAHVGVLWEGTSNINSLDIVQRAVGRVGADAALGEAMDARLGSAQIAAPLRERVGRALGNALDFARRVAEDPAHEKLSRRAARLLYDATSTALLAAEGAELAAKGQPDTRSALADWLLRAGLEPRDPYALDGAQFGSGD